FACSPFANLLHPSFIRPVREIVSAMMMSIAAEFQSAVFVSPVEPAADKTRREPSIDLHANKIKTTRRPAAPFRAASGNKSP
ncbi:MAG TPA: hypothetical protein VIU02_08300, partial [Burkholderiales bacterium]